MTNHTTVQCMGKSPDIRWKQRHRNFSKALQQLQEGVAQNPADRLAQEGLIQRFEYTFELAWKCLQDLLQERGYAEIRGPRPVLEQAFQDGLIADGILWFAMLKARNEASHLYDETVFLKLYAEVKEQFLEPLRQLADTLQSL